MSAHYLLMPDHKALYIHNTRRDRLTLRAVSAIAVIIGIVGLATTPAAVAAGVFIVLGLAGIATSIHPTFTADRWALDNLGVRPLDDSLPALPWDDIVSISSKRFLDRTFLCLQLRGSPRSAGWAKYRGRSQGWPYSWAGLGDVAIDITGTEPRPVEILEFARPFVRSASRASAV